MKLTYKVGNELVKMRVTPERELLMQSTLTNGKWVGFREAVQKSNQDGKSAEITEKIIKCLPTMDDVEWYVRDEFKKQGLELME